eukprot:c10546_g1_i1 orf=144-485(-)
MHSLYKAFFKVSIVFTTEVSAIHHPPSRNIVHNSHSVASLSFAQSLTFSSLSTDFTICCSHYSTVPSPSVNCSKLVWTPAPGLSIVPWSVQLALLRLLCLTLLVSAFQPSYPL